MTKDVAIRELEHHVITSISDENRQHININVAKRVVSEIFDYFENTHEVFKSAYQQGVNDTVSEEESERVVCTDFKIVAMDMKGRKQEINQSPNGSIFTISVKDR